MNAVQVQFEAVPCIDDECDGKGEPEVQGEIYFIECGTCGSEWGYQRVATQTDETCQVGIPEDVRRAASGPMEQALADADRPKMIPLSVKR